MQAPSGLEYIIKVLVDPWDLYVLQRKHGLIPDTFDSTCRYREFIFALLEQHLVEPHLPIQDIPVEDRELLLAQILQRLTATSTPEPSAVSPEYESRIAAYKEHKGVKYE